MEFGVVNRKTEDVSRETGSAVEEDFNIHRKIFVGNISYRIKPHKLTKFFSKFGAVEHCYIVKDHIKGWSKGIGFITFQDTISMEKALKATEHQLILDGRQMRVKPAELSHKTTFWQKAATNQNEEDWDVSCDQIDQSRLSDKSHDQIGADYQLTDGTPIDELFDEVLLHIFNMLTFKERVGVERVCHRWKKIIHASWKTYRSLNFKNFFKRFGGLTDKNLNSALLRCGPYLESLDLSASPGLLTDFSMNVIGNYCQDLKQLDISSVKITDISLIKLASKCCRLQRCGIQVPDLSNMGFSIEGQVHFSRQLVKKVKMNGCNHITDNKGLRSLLQANPGLESVDLSHNLQVTGECFRTAGPNLKTVILSKCLGVKNRFLNHLVKNCPHLEELNLSHCKGLTAEGLRIIVQNFKSLQILNVCATSIEDPSFVFSGPVELVNLEHADFSYNSDFGDTCLRLLSQNCPNLRYLDISGCNHLTNEGLISLTRLNHLESLIASFLSRNNQIEDSLVSIGDRGLLKKLVVRASPYLTNQGVLHIVSACPQVDHLDLSECFNITNSIFEGFKKTFVDENKTIDLYLGGTSVDWVGQDIDWLNGFSHLKVHMNSLALPQMRPDRDLIFSELDLSDDDDEYRPHPPITDFLPDGPVEAFDDWEEDFDDFDDFLENDDPLEAERWDLS